MSVSNKRDLTCVSTTSDTRNHGRAAAREDCGVPNGRIAILDTQLPSLSPSDTQIHGRPAARKDCGVPNGRKAILDTELYHRARSDGTDLAPRKRIERDKNEPIPNRASNASLSPSDR